MPRQLSRDALGGERLSREALVAHQRDRILDAAIGVFAKRGYQQTTVDHIVAAAKGSVGGFYQHFENKEDCFLALLDRTISRARDRVVDESASAGADWAASAQAGMAAMLAAAVAEPMIARIVLVEAQSAGREATARYRAICDEAAAALRGGRRHYPAAQALPRTFEQAAVSGTAYFLRQRLLAGELTDEGGLLKETSQIVLGPIVGPAGLRRLGGAAATTAG